MTNFCCFVGIFSVILDKNKIIALVYAGIELINGDDLVLARKHFIGKEEVKRMPVNMLVDTVLGAIPLEEMDVLIK